MAGKGSIASGVMLVLVAGGVYGVAKVNDINSIDSAYYYFKAWSDKLDGCYSGEDPSCGKIAEITGTTPKNIDPTDPNGTTVTVKAPALTPSSPREQHLEALEALAVSDGSGEYDATQWPHWLEAGECTTREAVLKAMGTEVIIKPGEPCSVISGSWSDFYGGDDITESNMATVDHAVPLSYVAVHGGNELPDATRKALANDTANLVVTTEEQVTKKANLGPSKFNPESKENTCVYAKTWVSTLTKYGLSVTKDDQLTIRDEIQKCQG